MLQLPESTIPVAFVKMTLPVLSSFAAKPILPSTMIRNAWTALGAFACYLPLALLAALYLSLEFPGRTSKSLALIFSGLVT